MDLNDWPELSKMSRDELVALIEKIREELYTEDARDTLLALAELLNVDLST